MFLIVIRELNGLTSYSIHSIVSTNFYQISEFIYVTTQLCFVGYTLPIDMKKLPAYSGFVRFMRYCIIKVKMVRPKKKYRKTELFLCTRLPNEKYKKRMICPVVYLTQFSCSDNRRHFGFEQPATTRRK